jgi:two-component system phosphate regulon sensor histidine kinase PhoR
VHHPLFSPRIRLAFILPALTALAVSVPLIWILLSSLLQSSAATQLLNVLPVMTGMVDRSLTLEPQDLQDEIRGLAQEDEVRLTVIDGDGQVLADSARTWSQVLDMDNHANRPEVVQALQQGAGTSIRRSDTTGIRYVYAATVLKGPDGDLKILRLAQPLHGLDALRRELTLVLAATTAAALIGIASWLWWIERKIASTTPELLTAAAHLERGDFSYRVAISSQTEIGRIGRFLNNVAVKADGKISRLTTEREHLLAVVSSMREGVLVTDAEGFTRMANPAFQSLFDITGKVEGRTPLELTRQTKLEDLIIATLASGEPQSSEIQLEAPTVRHLFLATSSLGESSGVVVVARDTTDVVLLGQMRRDFVANVSHELKTPLTAIRGYAETLRYGAMDDGVMGERFLDRILQQCARLQALLEDLLTLSRLESLDGESERTRVQLDELLEDCLDSIAPQVAEREIRLSVEAEAIPEFEGDRDSLERLIINLLDNAVKYNRTGGSVTARLAQHNGEVIFEVADTGIGIPANTLNRVFERFYRVDKGRSRDEGGTGLGLAIVKHVAQLHGGRVDVESRLGEGSVFRVHLPMHRP